MGFCGSQRDSTRRASCLKYGHSESRASHYSSRSLKDGAGWSHCHLQETSFAFVEVSHKPWRRLHECMCMCELCTERGHQRCGAPQLAVPPQGPRWPRVCHSFVRRFDRSLDVAAWHLVKGEAEPHHFGLRWLADWMVNDAHREQGPPKR